MSVRAMSCKAGMIAVVIVILLVGCKGSQPAAVSGSGSETSPVPAADRANGVPSSSGGTRVAYIHDPSLEMNAIAVTIPASWQFDSVFLQGGTCVPTPFGVFRATRPDGMSMVERMPSLAWAWGQGPMIGYIPKTDCLPMKGPMSAQDFLKFMAQTMNVHYDSDLQVPPAEEAKAQKQLSDAHDSYAAKFAAAHLQQPKQTRELARAAVSFTKGTTAMKGLLDVTVDCTETQYAGQSGLSNGSPGHPPQIVAGHASTVDKCVASVTYYAAPANQLAALMQQWEAPGMGTKPMDDWVQAWIARSNLESQRAIADMNDRMRRQREANAAQFAHSMAVQQQMHDQFMQTMQEGHEHFMVQQQANQNARAASASDWVDFALDRQTVMNTNTGLVYKISNQYTINSPEEVQMHGNGTAWNSPQ